MDDLGNVEEELNVRDFLSLAAVGDPAQVKAQLEQLANELGIHEFMFTIAVFDPQKTEPRIGVIGGNKSRGSLS